MLDAALAPPADADAMLGRVRALVERELVPIVRAVDADGLYPEAVLRGMGTAGAFGTHLPAGGAGTDLSAAIGAIAAASEVCLSTGFCAWCQDALGWYVACSDNESLKATLGAGLADGSVLGGTGLSNPMKTFFGIETIKLRGTRVEGGWRVTGALPWVSNLGPGHHFACVFGVEGEESSYVMAAIPCATEGLGMSDHARFVALDGTRTYALRFRDAFVPDALVLAHPVQDYVKRIRAGFVLLQTGMGIGLIEGCLTLMRQVAGPLGHVNRYLDQQPCGIEARLGRLRARVAALAPTPFDPSPAYWRAVVETRLEAGEAAVAAAHAAMLHCGARGYVATGAAQRRLREAYFVAIVTPATKQLRKMLADMAD